MAVENPIIESTADLSGIKVCHCRADDHDVYGGRGSTGAHVLTTPVGERGWLGNPYRLADYDDNRREVIARYVPAFYGRLRTDAEFREAVRNLDGKRVACWCRAAGAAEPHCHLDVIDHFLRGGRLFVRQFLTEDLAAVLEEDGEVVMLE